METDEMLRGWETSKEYADLTWDLDAEDKYKLVVFIRSLLHSRDTAIREAVKNDYIKWVLSSSYGRDYNGETPFKEWKELAEVEDMRHWD